MSKYIDYQAWELIKKNLFNSLHPIGEVITNGLASFDPNIEYPGTKWVRIKGRVIVGVDENDIDFNKVNKEGGSKNLQEHTHTIEGKYLKNLGNISGYGSKVENVTSQHYIAELSTINIDPVGTGKDGNLQPYITKYVWQRIA